MCGQNAAGVDVDRVATGRLDDLYPRSEQLLAEVFGAAQAVLQVIFVHDFFEPLRHGLEVAPGQSTVGDESLQSGSAVRRPCGSIRLIAQQQKAADIHQAVLLGADRGPVGEVEHVADDLGARCGPAGRARAAG
jgi:hypothetical protein